MKPTPTNQKPRWLSLALASAQDNAAANAVGRDPFDRPHLEASAVAGLIANLAHELSQATANTYLKPSVRNRIVKLARTASGLCVELFPNRPAHSR